MGPGRRVRRVRLFAKQVGSVEDEHQSMVLALLEAFLPPSKAARGFSNESARRTTLTIHPSHRDEMILPAQHVQYQRLLRAPRVLIELRGGLVVDCRGQGDRDLLVGQQKASREAQAEPMGS